MDLESELMKPTTLSTARRMIAFATSSKLGHTRPGIDSEKTTPLKTLSEQAHLDTPVSSDPPTPSRSQPVSLAVTRLQENPASFAHVPDFGQRKDSSSSPDFKVHGANSLCFSHENKELAQCF